MLSVVGFFGREFDSPRLHHFTPLFAVGPFPFPDGNKSLDRNASVYDRCTITLAEWHFPHFMQFLECATYRF